MSTSWADSAEDSVNDSSGNNVLPRPTRSTYVPPHLRNRPPSSEPAVISNTSSSPVNNRVNNGGPAAGSRWGNSSQPDLGRRPGGRPAGGNGRGGEWGHGREHEVNPFRDDEATDQALSEQENSGINFEAYDDIPVETSGNNVPSPVNTFAEIDLGVALNQNIQRCKYVKPTPVQRYAIPISLAGRDLMACAQTGSGKTAAFCFPIIHGIMKERYVQRSSLARAGFPRALILSPTRELSCQVDSSSLLCTLHCFHNNTLRDCNL